MTENLRNILTKELLKALNEMQDCGYKATVRSVDLFENSPVTFGIAGSEGIVKNEKLVEKILVILDKYLVFDEQKENQQELLMLLSGTAFNLSTVISNLTENYCGEEEEE